MKSFPFESKYLQDFHVVEERRGNVSFFPHTEQLPKLMHALNFEFQRGLPDRIARVDRRGSGYMKIQRHFAALTFCSLLNEARPDRLRLYALMGRDLVARVSIVQHSIERREQGSLHRFKFYCGDDFFTDVYIRGRQIVFSGHLMDRFSERIPNHVGTDLMRFLEMFYGAPGVLMECNGDPAFVYHYQRSIIALPVRQSDTEMEYFFPTCLTINQIHSLEPVLPPIAYNLQYDREYKMPGVRNWDIVGTAFALRALWQRKAPIEPEEKSFAHRRSWPELGHDIKHICQEAGFGEGSRQSFRDNIPGPDVLSDKLGGNEPQHVALVDLEKRFPGTDWKAAEAEQKKANPQWYSETVRA